MKEKFWGKNKSNTKPMDPKNEPDSLKEAENEDSPKLGEKEDKNLTPETRTLLDENFWVDATPQKVQELISKGADVNAENKKGMTAAHFAAIHGDVAIIKVLGENGADMNHGDIKAEFDKNFVYVPGTEPTTEDRTYYMEQVMVNYVWTYCMPYADFNLDLWANYIFLNTLYNALKVTLSCYLYQSKTVDEDFVFAVKTFDTALREGKGSIVRRVIDANSKDGLCNNGDMAILTIS